MQVLWTKGAEYNLQQINDYLAQKNPRAAHEMILKLIKAAELLTVHPQIGRTGRVPGTRELVVSGTPYLMPYRVKNNAVEVLRVLHGSMRWPTGF
jgi:toxin ParE1/3/4